MNPLGPVASALAAEGVNYAGDIVQAAQKNGVDPTLLAAVAAQETGGPGANGGNNIVGDDGHGHGLFQIDDRSHAFASMPAAADPAANADYAAGMLSGLLKRFGGNVREALSAYNAGSPTATGTKTTWGDGETLGYADSVLRHYEQLGGSAPAGPAANRALPDLYRAHHSHHGQRHWRSVMGTDPTGHQTGGGMTVDDYVNGGTSSS
jgi:hypothetical protein